MKKLMICALLIASKTVFGDIFCPQQFTCLDQKCTSSSIIDPDFSSFYFDSPPVENGTYYFSGAWSNKTSEDPMQCQYRNANGNESIILKTNILLIPDTGAHYSNWNNTDNQNYICNPNLTAPYLSDARLCPFYSIDINIYNHH